MMNLLHGALLGGFASVAAYWLFKQYMFNSPPAFAILAAAPLVLMLSWIFLPYYSRYLYRWSAADKQAL
jgi:hypothetical protein